ncbi:MAG TPA: response regulator [Longimicrobium sp.]|jgi:DNA-binding response OmpR family regulator|uniref:response regulator n=1 Tax=Longimicrobium sp. TaxID=2029185 RepID=UPI002EDB8B88
MQYGHDMLPPTDAGRKKILLIDDSATSHMWVKMILNKGDHEMLSAHDGEEGVARALSEKPDLILMDVVMPRMGGFEACRTLRARAETRATPIIMLTTRGEGQNVQSGYESGCNDYVTKPIDSVELLAKLRSYLGEDAAA